MPTYEYKCKKCGHTFDKFQSIMAGPIKKCPECGKNAVERLISAGGGLIFKGSGFYITDYRDSNYTDKAKADSAGCNCRFRRPGGESKPKRGCHRCKSPGKSEEEREERKERKRA